VKKNESTQFTRSFSTASLTSSLVLEGLFLEASVFSELTGTFSLTIFIIEVKGLQSENNNEFLYILKSRFQNT